MKSNVAKGFTLIELLVVIAIIAILAAILFPVFAQAKGAAKKTTSLSNVKQLALGHIMYANDYDDALCRTLAWGNPVGGLIQWEEAIFPYVKTGGNKKSDGDDGDPYNTNGKAAQGDVGIFVSPSFMNPARTRDDRGNALSSSPGFSASNPDHARTTMRAGEKLFSYGMNQALSSIFWAIDPNTGQQQSWTAGWGGPDLGGPSATLSSLGAVASTVLIGDTWGNFALTSAMGDDLSWRKAQSRYNGMVTIALCDGHAASIKGSSSEYDSSTQKNLTIDAEKAKVCATYFTGDAGRELPGSPVAACAPMNPNAKYWFGPRSGR